MPDIKAAIYSQIPITRTRSALSSFLTAPDSIRLWRTPSKPLAYSPEGQRGHRPAGPGWEHSRDSYAQPRRDFLQNLKVKLNGMCVCVCVCLEK